jgi:hypothetical protein
MPANPVLVPLAHIEIEFVSSHFGARCGGKWQLKPQAAKVTVHAPEKESLPAELKLQLNWRDKVHSQLSHRADIEAGKCSCETLPPGDWELELLGRLASGRSSPSPSMAGLSPPTTSTSVKSPSNSKSPPAPVRSALRALL